MVLNKFVFIVLYHLKCLYLMKENVLFIYFFFTPFYFLILKHVIVLIMSILFLINKIFVFLFILYTPLTFDFSV